MIQIQKNVDALDFFTPHPIGWGSFFVNITLDMTSKVKARAQKRAQRRWKRLVNLKIRFDAFPRVLAKAKRENRWPNERRIMGAAYL